jgi:hypothetical protein
MVPHVTKSTTWSHRTAAMPPTFREMVACRGTPPLQQNIDVKLVAWQSRTSKGKISMLPMAISVLVVHALRCLNQAPWLKIVKRALLTSVSCHDKLFSY